MPVRNKGVKPVRDVAKRTKRGRRAYIVPTDRNANGIVAGESFLERNHLLLLSLMPGFTRISDQSICVDLENENLLISRQDLPKKDGKKAVAYTADSEIERHDGQIFICESKPSAFLEKHADKHARAERILATYGKQFITFTEEKFSPVFISNLENLKKALSPAQKERAAGACEKVGIALKNRKRWPTLELKESGALSNADIFFWIGIWGAERGLVGECFLGGWLGQCGARLVGSSEANGHLRWLPLMKGSSARVDTGLAPRSSEQMVVRM
ncbi:hypothetical protein TOC8171_12800 [Pseudomonas syringae]